MRQEWWRSTSGEKEELLKGGVDKQRWQQGYKCSMHAGWMNNTRRSHDMWSSFKAVVQNYSMFTFDVTSAYTHDMLGRTNLSFWNRHGRISRNMVNACGGRSE